MLKYIAKRLVIGALTLLILSTITFFGVRAMPGDPFSQDNKVIAAETYEAMKAKFHLDKPLPEQYFIFLGNAIRGDFGESISKKGKLVSDIIALRFPVTAKLGAIAFCVSMVVGLAFGIIAALAKHRWVNSLITVISTLGVSLPNFLFAIMIMIVFAVKLGWLPIVGLNGPQYYILPVAALSLGPISSVTRLTRSSIRDVMHEDYITLSRSKGNKEARTIIVHGLKNALLPVVTYAGPLFAGMITGSLVIETLFSVPGIGAEFTNSITNRDYTLVMGLTILFGVLVIIMNLISDIVAAIIDPRIKLGK
ncbi:MAG: ABC transporter permease [Erysipelotrichaceae bacterium]|nr:ABC transporter permease [Erysipelotrichaceae bacterium]MBR6261059.1 ABC transporter permease [Erysipelotrichaceae bacterium]